MDTDCRMKSFELELEVGQETLHCRYYGFLPFGQTHKIREIADLSVGSRGSIEGWALFDYRDQPIRMDDFHKFTFTAQAMGEPKQRYDFSIFDKHSARMGNSTIVMLPTGSG